MNLPNYITILRIFLVPVFCGFLAYYDDAHSPLRFWALGIFILAIISDALDGFLARVLKQQTQLGTMLDPIADKLLLLSGFIGIAFSDAFVLKPPTWVVILIVFRDIFLVAGLGSIYVTTNKLPIAPNLLGKITTFFQMMTIVSVLAQWQFSAFIWFSTAVFTILSGASYLITGIGHLNRSNASL